MEKRKMKLVPKLVIWAIVLFILFLFVFGIWDTFFKKDKYPKKFPEEISAASLETSIDEATLYAVVFCESSFDERALSTSNAVGLMQLLPSTYLEISGDACSEAEAVEKLYDPAVNITNGAKYLSFLEKTLKSFLEGSEYNVGFTWELVHAAYHAGIGNVTNWIKEGKIGFDEEGNISSLPIPATLEYVQRIREVKAEYIKVLEKEEK